VSDLEREPDRPLPRRFLTDWTAEVHRHHPTAFRRRERWRIDLWAGAFGPETHVVLGTHADALAAVEQMLRAKRAAQTAPPSVRYRLPGKESR